ncbi:MAG: RbsD/FucU family protein [Erysipelotrichaceae bacterium]|nr:RbsD/FucU family protein [Erysipelotrichaceae bacterium]MBR5754799.1 RbsD/FucU family protein [Erysipelotrichaceae bacterium]
MLTTKLINPEIMAALSKCGHGSKVLIADGNYPLAEKSGNSKKVFLGVKPGLPTVTDVLEAIHSVCEIEAAAVMVPEDGSTPEIFAEFEKELGGMKLTPLGRYEFYDACMKQTPGEEVVLAIETGEKRTYANILITIGVA